MKPTSKRDLKKIEKKAEKAEKKGDADNLIIGFTPEKKIGKSLQLDEDNQRWLPVKNSLFQKGAGNVYRYSDILGYEILENVSTTVSSGSEFPGGTEQQPASSDAEVFVSHMMVRVILSDVKNPVVEIPLITSKVSKNSSRYRKAAQEAQDILSALAMAQRESGNRPIETGGGGEEDTGFSVADELKKLKDLVDAGVLMEEEFEEQKQKLLSKE